MMMMIMSGHADGFPGNLISVFAKLIPQIALLKISRCHRREGIVRLCYLIIAPLPCAEDVWFFPSTHAGAGCGRDNCQYLRVRWCHGSLMGKTMCYTHWVGSESLRASPMLVIIGWPGWRTRPRDCVSHLAWEYREPPHPPPVPPPPPTEDGEKITF